MRAGEHDPHVGRAIPVDYDGMLSDAFGEGREVVLKGRLTADDHLDVVPDGVMVRCPAKYDSSVLSHAPSRPRYPF
jgi:cytochrome c-type biogenesis protein CcmE